MKANKLKELKARNVLVENIFEKMKEITETEQDRLHWTSNLERIRECGTRQYKSKGALYKCHSKYCRICLTDERHKRYNKILKAFKTSEEKLEQGYVEAFLTLNYDYTSNEVKDMEINEFLAFFSKIFKKFQNELKELDCLGYIYKKEFPLVLDEKKFQLHYHLWICIKQENLAELQGVWQEATSNKGNLHIGSCEEYQVYKSYKCNQGKRNSKVEVKKIANYLAKSYLSITEAETGKNILVENIENENELAELIKRTDRKLDGFRALGFVGIFDVAKQERERKQEKSRMFVVLGYDKEKFENEKDYLNSEIYLDEDTLLLKFKSNSHCIGDIEKKLGGQATTLKGRGIWKDSLELGNFIEIKSNFTKRRKVKKKSEKEKKKNKKAPAEAFEIFGSIETIKQNVIRNGEKGQAWAFEVVQELLPLIEKNRVKELETERDELKEKNNLLKIENIELIKANETLEMRNRLQSKQLKETKAREKKIALFLLANYNSFKHIE